MNDLLRPLHDLRFQILDFRLNDVLMQTGYLNEIRIQLELPPSTFAYSVWCNLKSAIVNLQSKTVLPVVLGCSFDYAQDKLALRRTVQVRLKSNTLRLPGGKPIFTVSRQQFMKYPG
jgi:hypothetical protein